MKEISDEDIRGFLQTVRDHSIYDFYGYSLSSLRRRLLKITDDFHIDLSGLAGRMRTDPSLLELIVKKITVNTTELFRDPAVWISLKENILPRFRNQDSISVWHPGCSTGQEVYSMMMLLDHMGLLEKSNIYASDINTDVLAAARSGKYKYRFNSDYIRYFNMVF
ncbi:MAG: CheR family methyltransferase, partial [Bacteroidota bacterium]